MDGSMTVTQLWRYPVKSMAGEALDQTEVSDLGIDGDRQWGLVDTDTGLVLTARRVPDLLLASPVASGDTVAIRLPDGTITDDDATLSAWLGRSVALRRPEPDERGFYEIAEDDDDPSSDWIQWHGPKGVWHDSTRTRLSIVDESAMGHWDVRRFRPNVVVSGGDERTLVDTDVAIGSVRLRVMKEIDRCVIVTRPQPGLDRDRSVLTSVHRDRSGNLGVGAVVRRPGRIAIGDTIEVLR
ncbi:MOSC domain-containing protein [Actinospongicola halichondriae]|uniref:MOSC domain-containing protein n=1 Tax=Actinospongicola halichondriae TaxID=3236844 RepID=UPI003D40C73B